MSDILFSQYGAGSYCDFSIETEDNGEEYLEICGHEKGHDGDHGNWRG